MIDLSSRLPQGVLASVGSSLKNRNRKAAVFNVKHFAQAAAGKYVWASPRSLCLVSGCRSSVTTSPSRLLSQSITPSHTTLDTSRGWQREPAPAEGHCEKLLLVPPLRSSAVKRQLSWGHSAPQGNTFQH